MWNFLKQKGISSDKIESKSVNTQLTGSVSSIYSDFPSNVRLPDNSPDILNYYRGYAAAAISLISQAVGDLPYYMFRVENSGSGKYIGKSLKVNKSLYKHINKSFKTGDYTLSKIFEHPILEILESSNKLTITEFFYIITSYLVCIGNVYILKERDQKGNLKGLKVLLSEYVSIKFDKDLNIYQYIYQPLLGACNSYTYLPEDIIHISTKTAGSMIVGKGKLETALLSVSVSEQSKKHLNCLLNNHMSPQNLIVIKNTIKDNTQAESIKNKMLESFGGYNTGRNMVTFGEIDIKPVSTNMNDQQVFQINEFVRKEVSAIFGVPADLLSSQNSNRATILAAKEHFLKLTVMPLANTICDQLTKFIEQEYEKGFIISYDSTESIETNMLEQADLFQKYITMGVMTVEQAKEKLGFQ